MHHPTDRIPHTMAFVIPVVEHWLEISVLDTWVPEYTPRGSLTRFDLELIACLTIVQLLTSEILVTELGYSTQSLDWKYFI